MKTIIFNKLSLNNFGGLVSFKTDFSNPYILEGPTGSGKSCIIKAIQYALGVNVGNELPTKDDLIIKDLETNVLLELTCDNQTIKLLRTNSQKWGNNKITGEFGFAGNEKGYFINNEPIAARSYQPTICSMIGITPQQLELLSDIKAFNDLKWEERRNIIFNSIDIDKINNKLFKNNDYEFIKDAFENPTTNDISFLKELEDGKKSCDKQLTENKNLIQFLQYEQLQNQNPSNNDENFNIFEPQSYETEIVDKFLVEKIKSLKMANLKVSVQVGEWSNKISTMNDFVIEKNKLAKPLIDNVFSGLKFNLWTTTTSTADRKYKNCCETILSETGSAYDAASCGERIYINFLVGEALRNLWNINFPMIIDDRNSITLDLNTNSQKIELITQKQQNFKVEKTKDKYINAEVI